MNRHCLRYKFIIIYFLKCIHKYKAGIITFKYLYIYFYSIYKKLFLCIIFCLFVSLFPLKIKYIEIYGSDFTNKSTLHEFGGSEMRSTVRTLTFVH